MAIPNTIINRTLDAYGQLEKLMRAADFPLFDTPRFAWRPDSTEPLRIVIGSKHVPWGDASPEAALAAMTRPNMIDLRKAADAARAATTEMRTQLREAEKQIEGWAAAVEASAAENEASAAAAPPAPSDIAEELPADGSEAQRVETFQEMVDRTMVDRSLRRQ